MKKIIIIFSLLVSGLVLFSCQKDLKMTETQKAFTEMASPGLVSSGNYVIEFVADSCQISSTTDGRYRIMTDTQSQYVEAVIEGGIGKVGATQKVALKWFKDGKMNEEELDMVVSLNSGDTYWLWNEENSKGVILRKLI